MRVGHSTHSEAPWLMSSWFRAVAMHSNPGVELAWHEGAPLENSGSGELRVRLRRYTPAGRLTTCAFSADPRRPKAMPRKCPQHAWACLFAESRSVQMSWSGHTPRRTRGVRMDTSGVFALTSSPSARRFAPNIRKTGGFSGRTPPKTLVRAAPSDLRRCVVVLACFRGSACGYSVKARARCRERARVWSRAWCWRGGRPLAADPNMGACTSCVGLRYRPWRQRSRSGDHLAKLGPPRRQ